MPPRKSAAAARVVAKKPPVRRPAAQVDGRADRAAALMEHVNKKMSGRAELVRASELSLPYITKRWPTGLLSLDLELRGGWPSAGVSQIVGPKNAGKDYLVWQTLRQGQHMLGNRFYALLAQTEMRADRTQGRAVGCQVAMSEEDIVSMERARVNNGWPEYTEEEKASLRYEVGHIHEAHGYAAEDLYDIILRAIENRVYHVIVINSFGSIMSGAEAEAETLREKTYSGSAGVNTQFLHKLTALLTMKTPEGETRDTCVIGINQIRDDIKNPNAPYKSSGGRALEHAKFVDLFVTSGKFMEREIRSPSSAGAKDMKDRWGKEVNWRIEKGKAGIHEGAVGNYLYRFHQPRSSGTDPIIPINSADFYMDTLVAGQKLGIVQLSGTWASVIDEQGNELAKAQGTQNLAVKLYEDAVAKVSTNEMSLMNIIRQLCFRKADINIDYNWE
jgi:RecA/RadA recombinase